jgi:peroxiredoxin Q/BCP
VLLDHEGPDDRKALLRVIIVTNRSQHLRYKPQGASKMPLIEAGKKAPAFTLKDQHGETHRLSDYEGRPVVLYFYPKDDTPGCTKEACAFQANLPRFKPSKAAILGVSVLDEASKARFAEKYDLTFPLLADADHAVAEKYGVWQEKQNYGKSYMGLVRTTYLIGPDGKVAKRWSNVKVDGHADAVLEAVKEL